METENNKNLVKTFKENINQGLKQTFGTIIPAKNVNYTPDKVQVIGGDGGMKEHEPPAIIIEKKNGQISKIIVKCPCGRTSELICEYTDEETNTSQE